MTYQIKIWDYYIFVRNAVKICNIIDFHLKEEALDRTMWRNLLEEALDLSSDRILNNNKSLTNSMGESHSLPKMYLLRWSGK